MQLWLQMMWIIQVEENLRFVLSTAPHIFWDQPTTWQRHHLLHKLAWFPSQCMEKHGTSWMPGPYKIHTSCNAPPGFCTPGRRFSVTCFTRSFQETQTDAVNQVQVLENQLIQLQNVCIFLLHPAPFNGGTGPAFETTRNKKKKNSEASKELFLGITQELTFQWVWSTAHRFVACQCLIVEPGEQFIRKKLGNDLQIEVYTSETWWS